jgi:hypothetical protein
MDDSGIVGHVATLCFGEYDILGMNKFGIEVRKPAQVGGTTFVMWNKWFFVNTLRQPLTYMNVISNACQWMKPNVLDGKNVNRTIFLLKHE